MRSRLFALVAIVAGLAALTVGAPVAAGSNGSDEATACVFTTQLRAENEVPTSNSTAFGYSQIKVRNDGTIEFKTHINNKNHETFVAGHIHQAPVGVAGPVVVPLFVAPTPPTSARHIKQSGVATPNAGTTGAALCQNPSAYYVNYHTTVFPAGAIRGQLH